MNNRLQSRYKLFKRLSHTQETRHGQEKNHQIFESDYLLLFCWAARPLSGVSSSFSSFLVALGSAAETKMTCQLWCRGGPRLAFEAAQCFPNVKHWSLKANEAQRKTADHPVPERCSRPSLAARWRLPPQKKTLDAILVFHLMTPTKTFGLCFGEEINQHGPVG